MFTWREIGLNIEKHVVALMTAIILALMGWTTHTVHQDSKILARLDERMKAVERFVYGKPQSSRQEEVWRPPSNG